MAHLFIFSKRYVRVDYTLSAKSNTVYNRKKEEVMALKPLDLRPPCSSQGLSIDLGAFIMLFLYP